MDKLPKARKVATPGSYAAPEQKKKRDGRKKPVRKGRPKRKATKGSLRKNNYRYVRYRYCYRTVKWYRYVTGINQVWGSVPVPVTIITDADPT